MTVALNRSHLLRVVRRLPVGCTLEEAINRINLRAAIEEAETDVTAGRTHTQAEVMHYFERRWQRRS